MIYNFIIYPLKKTLFLSLTLFSVIFKIDSQQCCTFFNENFFFKKINFLSSIDVKKEEGTIIISNHNQFTDATLIKQFIKCFTIVQADKRKSYGFLINKFYDMGCTAFNAVPYVRGNKDSGTIVKDIVLRLIKEKKNVLVFPEGGCQKNSLNGLTPFKKGIFYLSFYNNIPILLTTIEYSDKNFGIDKDDRFTLNKILKKETDATLEVHKKVYPKEFKSFDEFYNYCFDTMNDFVKKN